MKKVLAIIVVFAVLIGAYSGKKEFSLQNYFSGEYCSYSNSPANKNSIFLGTCYLNSGIKVDDPVGESVKVYNLEAGAAIKKLSAKVVKTELIDSGATIIYAYSNLIPRSVTVNESKVNLQIACYQDYSIVGWPLILGSY